jgi:exopolyphosphatase/guanosine-5'-triphosphate,3'-diphosphate pyrophosphatase
MTPVRVAVVDVGANTLRLLVAVPDGHGIIAVHEQKEQLSLGEDVERFGYITEAKCIQAVETARGQMRAARRLGAERIEILVTSPGRQSANSDDFADALRRGTGVPVRILSQEEEGMLAWDGAVSALERLPASVAVCDVGGGSAQLVVGTPEGGPAWVRSVDLGSLRLTARHLADSDPPSAGAVEAARATAAEAFAGIVPPPARVALAAGGTARALRRVVDSFDAESLGLAIETLSGLKRSKISRRYGIPPPRAATLLAGTLLFAEAQERLGVPLQVAEAGVREGGVLALFRESAAAYA